MSTSELSLKTVFPGEVEVERPAKGPVADDYLYDFKYNHPLPTIAQLGVDVAQDADAGVIAQELFDKLAAVLAQGDAAAFTDLFLEHGVWRDKLVYTWEYRTFNFRANIAKAARVLLPKTHASSFRYLSPKPNLQRPYDDLTYLQFSIAFDTELAGASAVVNAVSTHEGWKIWTLHTVIESLHRFPETEPANGHMTGSLSWETQRLEDTDKTEPDVLVIGGGQNGLALAARLKALDVKCLIIERNERIGDIWRHRYEYLSLHFPHWADHLPYFPFPEHWPTYTPAQKMGLFMEWYVSALELAVWTSSTVTEAHQDEAQHWHVSVKKAGQTRTLKAKHLVMATSLCGVPLTPAIPGLDGWTGGVYRHSSAHDSSRQWEGKKVLVVGTSSSGFDTAYDCSRRNIDVTLLQRSPTYVMSLTHSVSRIIGGYAPIMGIRPNLEEQDRLWFSMPTGPGEELARRNTEVLERLDHDLLDGLHRCGLKTWRGQRGTGTYTLGQTRNGGFYYEAGACKEIINGKIKLEQGFIESFTEDKVILAGGRERHYDLVVFATGFSNVIDSVRATLGDEIANRCGPIWGIDEEGEAKSAYKLSGVSRLWMMVGFLPFTRFHSKRLALRLKALLEGISPEPYLQ